MKKLPTVLQEFKKLNFALFIVGVVIIATASYWGLYVATQVGVGVLLSIASTHAYAVLVWTIIVKKNIAWIGPVIVIKYSLLIASAYFVWIHGNVFLVLVGLLAQLILTALFVALLKSRDLRRVDNGSL